MDTTDETGWQLLTMARAARRAGVGIRQLLRASDAGDLPVYDVGRWARVRWTDVLAWLEGKRRRVVAGGGDAA